MVKVVEYKYILGNVFTLKMEKMREDTNRYIILDTI